MRVSDYESGTRGGIVSLASPRLRRAVLLMRQFGVLMVMSGAWTGMFGHILSSS